MNLNKLQSIAGYPNGKKELIKKFQNTNDIVKAVIEQHDLNRNAFKKLATHFDRGNDYDTCQAIWEFVHYNLNYKAEPDLQTVKTVSKILYDGSNSKGNDCKHFSCFEAGILEALGIPYFYRFAAYDGKIPTHVYVVANLKRGSVIMDAVLPYFDSEKSYTYKIDINPLKKKDMPLYRLSGVSTIGAVSEVQHKIRLVTFAAARGAILELTKFNVFNLAVKFNLAIMKDRKKVEDFWYNVGGKDFGKLLDAAIEGKTKKRILGLDQDSTTVSPDYNTAKIGTPLTFIVALLPALPSIISLFMSLNIKHDDINVNQALPPEQKLPTTPPTNQPQSASTNNLLLIGGAAILAIFLLKK
jgi:ferritin